MDGVIEAAALPRIGAGDLGASRDRRHDPRPRGPRRDRLHQLLRLRGGRPHAIFGCLVLAALALKVLAVRVGGSSSPLLPWIGAALFVLFTATWLTSAGDFLGVD
jgi:hypothetical protein